MAWAPFCTTAEAVVLDCQECGLAIYVRVGEVIDFDHHCDPATMPPGHVPARRRADADPVEVGARGG